MLGVACGVFCARASRCCARTSRAETWTADGWWKITRKAGIVVPPLLWVREWLVATPAAGRKRLPNPARQKSRSQLGFDGGVCDGVWWDRAGVLAKRREGVWVCEPGDADAASSGERVVGIVWKMRAGRQGVAGTDDGYIDTHHRRETLQLMIDC